MKVMVPMLFLGCKGDAVGLTKYIEAPKQAGLLLNITIKEFKSGHYKKLKK
jgi:hypothetical protein